MVDFSNRLKELRIQAGLTQKELADKIWVTKASISYYEQSERTPSPEILIKLSDFFHVTTDYLLGIEKKQQTLDISGLENEDIEFLQHAIAILKKKNRHQ